MFNDVVAILFLCVLCDVPCVNWMSQFVLVFLFIVMKVMWHLTFEKQNEILLVVASFGVFPIHVQPIEVTVPEERDGAVDECLTGVSGRRHYLELLSSKGPSTCKTRIVFL
jgi:hypothetical protein